MTVASHTISPNRVESLVILYQSLFVFPYNMNSRRTYFLFPLLIVKLGENRASPNLDYGSIPALSILPGSWLVLNI